MLWFSAFVDCLFRKVHYASYGVGFGYFACCPSVSGIFIQYS